MLAAMCEEVQNPLLEVLKVMVLAGAGPGTTEIVYILPILFVLPPVGILLAVKNGQPIGLLRKIANGSGGLGLLFVLLGIWMFDMGGGVLTA